jgi:hypothetical protein
MFRHGLTLIESQPQQTNPAYGVTLLMLSAPKPSCDARNLGRLNPLSGKTPTATVLWRSISA